MDYNVFIWVCATHLFCLYFFKEWHGKNQKIFLKNGAQCWRFQHLTFCVGRERMARVRPPRADDKAPFAGDTGTIQAPPTQSRLECVLWGEVGELLHEPHS